MFRFGYLACGRPTMGENNSWIHANEGTAFCLLSCVEFDPFVVRIQIHKNLEH